MKPWLIVSGDFTPLGGMDRANHALAAYLASTGRDVHLVAHRVSDDLASQRGIQVHAAGRPFHAHLVGAPLLAREARRQAARLGRDARVLINGGNAALSSATWVHYLHGAYEPETRGSLRSRLGAIAGRRYFLRSERAAIRRAPLVVCNSVRTRDDVERAYGVPRDRLSVVYYGVDATVFSPITPQERARARAALQLRGGRPAALFIGALGDRRKGFDVLFDAWQALAADPQWDCDLIVAGSGGELRAWTQRADAAGLADRIRFLGFRRDIDAMIAAADVLVHPARYEPYGLGVHEAICRGLPAIVTDACGVAEQYDAPLRPLIVRAPVEQGALARALREWHAARESWRERFVRLGATLRARSWDDMAAEIAAAVESR